uniref:HVA22-like protein n=1 Tax=Quercus lobata TaxID=97700 RepID=A0A7N2MDA9_QUELO
MGTSRNNFLQGVAKNFDVLALYASIKAIETKSRTDDQQWLTYWVLYSMLTLFELTFAKVLEFSISDFVCVCSVHCAFLEILKVS